MFCRDAGANLLVEWFDGDKNNVPVCQGVLGIARCKRQFNRVHLDFNVVLAHVRRILFSVDVDNPGPDIRDRRHVPQF